MDDTQVRLDGNAAAGMLSDLFADDLSGARGQCAACGMTAQVGGQHLYMHPLSPRRGASLPELREHSDGVRPRRRAVPLQPARAEVA
jgi:hypothetical protein